MKTPPSKAVVFVALFAALTALGGVIRLTFGEVIVTLQFFFALLAGVFLGKKYGPLSQIVYLILGLFGVPVFGAGGGFAYVLKPTFGFVLALPAAAFLAGLFSEKKAPLSRRLFGFVLALGAVYLVGVIWFFLSVNVFNAGNTPLGKILSVALVPYIPVDAAKIFLALFIAQKLPRDLI